MADAPLESEFDANHDPAPSRFSNPLTVAWQHKSLLALGLVVGTVLGVLYYSQKTPIYQSSAQILVIKKSADPVPTVGAALTPIYVEDYLATHTILLRSQDLLRQAGKLLAEEHPEAIPPGADPASFIAGGLTVSRESRDASSGPSNVLNLSFRGTQPEHCPQVVNAVISAYFSYINKVYNNINDDFVKHLTRAEEILQIQIKEKQEALQKIVDTNPLESKDKGGIIALQERINHLETRLADLAVRYGEIKVRLEQIDQAQKDNKDEAIILRLLESSVASKAQPSAADVKPRSPSEMLDELELQELDLLADFGKDHPAVVAHRRKMDALRKRMGQPVSSPSSEPRAKAAIESGIQALRAELADNESLQGNLKQLIATERGKAEKLARFHLDEERARKNLEPLEKLYDSIISQMQQSKFKGEVKGDSRVYDTQTIVEAGPGSKISPHLMQTLLAAGFLGLIGGIGLAYVSELTDKSFHTPEEIRRRLGLRVIGHIPHIEEAKGELVNGLVPQLCTAHSPKSMTAEAFRGLRTALYFSVQGRAHKVLQVTSPHMGDGKSTLAANLAISIAQSGKSVVLIDADFRRPKIHRFFNIQNPTVGLASVISGDAELADAIQPCAIPELFILPCGTRPANPAELLTSPKFQDLLKVIREKYDFVLIDTPPLLVVSDPAVVAPRLDGVILTIRVTKNSRPVAERAKELLGSLGANILGVVVNGFEESGGAGRYGYAYRYGYSYGYNYQYKYGYPYSYDSNDEDEDDANTPAVDPSRSLPPAPGNL